MSSAVTRNPVATPQAAVQHFSNQLSFQTDCWDVNHAIANRRVDFVLLDVRGKEYFDAGHVPSAIHFPHWEMNKGTLDQFPQDTIFVVYCAGPHCNGAHKAAIALAQHGFRVKEMIGGAIGWLDEGFALVVGDKQKALTRSGANHE